MLKKKDVLTLNKIFPDKKRELENCLVEDLILYTQNAFFEREAFLRGSFSFYEAEWPKFNDKWQDYLEKFFFGVVSNKGVTAALTLLPIYPRDLCSRSFLVPATYEKEVLLSVVAHELIHFYYYDFLEQMNLNSADSKKIWVLSELLVPLMFSYYSKNNTEQLKCSSYLFQKGFISKYEDTFIRSWREKQPFLYFFQQAKSTKIDMSGLNKKFL